VRLLNNAVDYDRRPGVSIKRLLSDNGVAFRSRNFRQACLDPDIRHRFARAGRPQSNGTANGSSNDPARVDLRPDVPELRSAHPSLGSLATSRPLPSTPQRHWGPAAHLQTRFVKKPPLDASKPGNAGPPGWGRQKTACRTSDRVPATGHSNPIATDHADVLVSPTARAHRHTAPRTRTVPPARQ